MLYWVCSWLAQTFALPLALLSGLLVVFAFVREPLSVPAPVVAALACLLELRLHRRSWRVGRDLLSRVTAEVVADAGAPDQADVAVPVSAGLNPFAVRDSRVERIRDLAYGPHGDRNLLDIYRPKGAVAGARLPVLIQVHGGAWVYGVKDNQGLPLMYHLAARGWLCIALNYRLAPSHAFPAMLDDVLAVVAWTRGHASDYGGNPDFIALTGGSAGGHLSALAALVGSSPERTFNGARGDASVQAVMPLYGRYDFLNRDQLWGRGAVKLTRFKSRNIMRSTPEAAPDLWAMASPVDQVHASAPPFFVVHGSYDSLIDCGEARSFVAALDRAGTECLYTELPGAQHAFDILLTPLTACFVRAAATWLNHCHDKAVRREVQL